MAELFGWEIDAARQVTVLEGAGAAGTLEARWDPAGPPKQRGGARRTPQRSVLAGLVRGLWLLLAVAVVVALVVAWLHSMGEGGEDVVEVMSPEETTETWD